MTIKPRRRVCVLYVGGTIGMTRDVQGVLGPDESFLTSYVAKMPELARADAPSIELVSLPPLLDSADMEPSDWLRIADAVVTRYSEFDGFVVLHGTDTMAYSASALSFLFESLDKPIILTGAQLSLDDLRSDGREHLITSTLLAATSDVPEVCIYFGSRLLRGNRAQKTHSEDFVAFESGNFPPLATVGARVAIARGSVRAKGAGAPKTRPIKRMPKIGSLRVFPGIPETLVDAVLSQPLDGLVLETYGVGNVPRRFAEHVGAATRDRELVIVNCSQCRGRVHASAYAGGAALAKTGVVSGHDMTPEAALTKLYCLSASGLDAASLRHHLELDLAGELTPS